MAISAAIKVGKKGQVTLPRQLRKALGIEPGNELAVRSVVGGVLLSKGLLTTQAQDVLQDLVIGIGAAAEARGIREDADLDGVIEEIQREVYRKYYGG